MIFIGVALVVAIGIAFLISADAGSMVGLSQNQVGQLIPLVIILLLFAASIFARRRRFGEMFGNVLLWVGIFGVAILGYSFREDVMGLASRVAGELRPGIAIVDADRGTATFKRGMGGHFEVQATINGHTMPLIFDTGASAVVLTSSDAEKAGIDTENLRFTIPVSTANGTGRAASVMLDTIEIGGIVRKRIQAFISEDGALETSLLGMTFLETLNRYAVSNDALELTD